MKTGLKLMAVAVLLAFAWLARQELLLAFFALVIAVVFSFPVRWFSRLLPRGAAVLLLVVLILGGVTVAAMVAAPALSEQVEDLARTVPKQLQKARNWLRAQGAKNVEEKAGQAAQKASEVAVPAILGIVFGLSEAVLVFVLALFLVAAPETYRDGVRKLVPREREPVFDESWRRTGTALRKWVGGIFVSMTIMGTLAAVGLAIAGIHDWLLLGLITFLGTFVPYVGAVASAIPGLLVAISQSPQHFFYALAVYLGVHLVEGYLIAPLIMRRAVEIKPALLLTGQGVLSAIFGVFGAVVATPMIVCVQTLVEFLWVERKLAK
ncbi:MAG TPA: AI-2E family transporter [Myxococcales bacterium]|nr:AI-2E family transporter [Myxococcales bacterium]